MSRKMYRVRHIWLGKKPSYVRYYTKEEALKYVEFWKNNPLDNCKVVYAGEELVNEDGSTKRKKK